MSTISFISTLVELDVGLFYLYYQVARSVTDSLENRRNPGSIQTGTRKTYLLTNLLTLAQ